MVVSLILLRECGSCLWANGLSDTEFRVVLIDPSCHQQCWTRVASYKPKALVAMFTLGRAIENIYSEGRLERERIGKMHRP